MGLQRFHCMVLLLLICFFQVHISLSTTAEAGQVPFTKQERYVAVLESLGIKCRCCDGAGGECRSGWDSTCSKLDCHNLKFL
ncbi:hypothetical protein B296_00011142 [Ensete ventricosum]|uniref:Uncharacterized protein n=1 Tax=Ensete ventricosum TaxID=4639 RepID=A0A427AFS7_ENSVE|nr:hypothetical protein B296_00011142 [Ensete ventricosum]